MKKIIGICVGVLILVSAINFYFANFHVPRGEEFDIKYTNLRKYDRKGMPEEEKYELTDHGFFTRTNFVKQDDEVNYMFDIVNDGTLDAVLKYDPIMLSGDYYFKKHIDYKITYSNGDKIKKGDTLNVGETKSILVSIKYNSAETSTRDSQFYESNAYFWFVYKR